MLAGIYGTLLTVGATAETVTVTRGLPCASEAGSFLLAVNSGALVRFEETSTDGAAVIVFRPTKKHGWASQRLLSRFDLELVDNGVQVINSGLSCREGS